MTPDEIRYEKEQRRRQALRRFRRVGRLVAANRAWLSEIEGQFGDNVRRNVALIVKRKGEKGILALKEKSLLNTPWWFRNDEQRKQSVMLMCSFRCLSQFTAKIRARLAKVARYMYVTAGRAIIREGHTPTTLFFILDGEVSVSRLMYNPIDKTWEDHTLGLMGAGDMFGEVGLLNNCKRTSTVKAAIDTDLLCVDVEDFFAILYEPLKLKWSQVRLALDRFEYFHGYTTGQLLDCSALAKIQQYSPLQTIYAEDTGKLNPVFFVLSGSCMILQCLKMNCKIGRKSRIYELQAIEKNTHTKSQEFLRKMHLAAHEKRKQIAHHLEDIDADMADRNDRKSTTATEVEATQPSVIVEKQNSNESMRSGKSVSSDRSRKLVNSSGTKRSSLLQPAAKQTAAKPDKRDPQKQAVDMLEQIEFVEVGRFNNGSVFGLGEEMEHRTIVAKEPCQCLLIPRFWLMDKPQNRGNMWHRLRMWLDLSVPSRQKTFEDFLATNRWREYRREVVEDVLRQDQQPRTNTTTVLDVPLICRIMEGSK